MLRKAEDQIPFLQKTIEGLTNRYTSNLLDHEHLLHVDQDAYWADYNEDGISPRRLWDTKTIEHKTLSLASTHEHGGGAQPHTKGGAEQAPDSSRNNRVTKWIADMMEHRIFEVGYPLEE